MNLIINYSSKWWYKLITIILICAIILYFSIGIAPKASAVVVSTVIVGTVLAAMAAAGIGLTVSGMTAQELTTWVSDKLTDWTTDIGGSIQDHIENSLIGVTANGVIAVGEAAARGISDFLSWLQNEDSITDNSTVIAIPSTLTLNGKNIVELPTVDMTVNYSDGTSTTYQWAPKNNGDKVYAYYKLGSGIQIFTMNTTIREFYRYYNGNRSNIEFDALNHGYRYNTVYWDVPTWSNYYPNTTYSGNPYDVFGNASTPIESGSIDYTSSTITIPTINTGEKWYLDVGADSGEDIDTVTDGVITDTLTNTLEVTDEVVESNVQEVVIVNEDSIAVNVDHHMIGFSNFPDFAHLNLNSIWHYVSDAVDFASSWLAWFVSFLTAMPLLAIPLYMSFTLLVVLSFLRRFI